MNHSEIEQQLAKDIAALELPPISERVYAALREKKQEQEEGDKSSLSVVRRNKIFRALLLVSMLTALVVSVPLSVRLAGIHPTEQNTSQLSDVSAAYGCDDITASTNESCTSTHSGIRQLQLEQRYGTVFLSERKESELVTLIHSYRTEDTVYEDERYLYCFDPFGRLREISRLHYAEAEKTANEEEIRRRSSELIQEFFLEFAECKTIDIEEAADAYPHWNVTYIKNSTAHTVLSVQLSFDESGDLVRMMVSGSEQNVGNITREEAVTLALRELKSGRYQVPSFDETKAEIITEIRNRDGRMCYYVHISKIPLSMNGDIEDKFFAFFVVAVDADTGEIVSVDR